MENKTLKDLAIEYSKYGLAVFPLVEGGKKPVETGGFHNATKDKATIEKWWNENPNYNIGIATGRVSGNLVVVDCDVKEEQGIDGRESIRNWELENGKFPETVTVTTGKGGQHIYFRYEGETDYRNTVGLLEGVDIRGEGGYVVAPGSKHPNGNYYEWDLSPEDYEIKPLNESAIKMLCYKEKTEISGFKVPEGDISEGGRYNTIFKIACSLQAKGLSDSSIVAAVHEENKCRCNPPLPEEEVNHAITDALKYQKGTPIDLNGKGKAPDIPKPVIYSAKDLATMELSPITFHVGQILADGVTILAAASKLGKSWLCLQLGIAVATGTDFLGYPTTPGTVLYIDLENDIRVSQDRLKKVLNGEPEPEKLLFMNDINRMGEGFEETIQYIFEQFPDIGLIIIDIYQRVCFLKSKGESDYDSAYRTMKVLKDICKDREISIVCVHHTRKAKDETDPFANILGSTGIMGGADETIVMTKESRDSKLVTMNITGRTVRNIDLVCTFNEETYHWDNHGSAGYIIEEQKTEKYNNNPLVKLIKQLVDDNNGKWEGAAGTLAQEGRSRNIFFGNTSTIGKEIKKVEQDLQLRDGISHEYKTKGRVHVFTNGFIPAGNEGEIPFKQQEIEEYE